VNATPDDDPDRREQILQAALRVFADRGYKAATIKRIADEAGLRSTALLYWYFANKEELFTGVMLRFAAVIGDDPVERSEFDRPPRELLASAMRNWLSRFEDPNTLLAYRVLILEVPLLREHGFRLDDDRPGNLFALLQDYLDHQVRMERLRPHDTRHAARSIVALLSLHVQSRYSAVLAPPPDDEAFVQASLDLLLEGLTPR
jgi:AcrR family transcriptional regulator